MEQLVTMEVECDNCGDTTDKKPAKVKRNDHNFCSTDCYHTWKANDWESPLSKEKVLVECEHCACSFRVHEYRQDSARFCSKECVGQNLTTLDPEDTPAYKGATIDYDCLNCGDTFRDLEIRNREYCSKSCYREASKELFAGENNPVWRGGWDWYYGPNWDEQREKAIERDNHECQRCGAPESDMDRSPDVHHIKRIGWFKEEYERPDWWVRGNKLENLVTLCRQCHQQVEWADAQLN